MKRIKMLYLQTHYKDIMFFLVFCLGIVIRWHDVSERIYWAKDGELNPVTSLLLHLHAKYLEKQMSEIRVRR